MSSELDLLYILSNKDNYYKYIKYVKDTTLTEVSESITKGFGAYFEQYDTATDINYDEFISWFKVIYSPRLNAGMSKQVATVLTTLSTHTTSVVSDDIVKTFIVRDFNNKISNLIIDSNEEVELELVRDLADEGIRELGLPVGRLECVDMSAHSLITNTSLGAGANWRLPNLVDSVGSVRGGNLIVVGARPETGKTSFCIAEGTFMLPQLPPDKEMIIFNNEELNESLGTRCISAATGMTHANIVADPDKADKAFHKAVGGPDKVFIYGIHDKDTRDIERTLKKHNAGIIVFNTMSKVNGFTNQKMEVQRQEKLFNWARKIAAVEDAIVFAIIQADATAEGEAYFDMSKLYGSKTAIQGEADVLFCIGKVHDAGKAAARYINIAKNKLPGDPGTNPALKHAQIEVRFEPETGRFW